MEKRLKAANKDISIIHDLIKIRIIYYHEIE